VADSGGDEQARDQRLYSAAAAHHEDAADSHDVAAAQHDRWGEAADAGRERTLAWAAREKARRLVRSAAALREFSDEARQLAAERLAAARELQARLRREGAARSRERCRELGEDGEVSVEPDPLDATDAERE
jgi:hypothetical protein